MRWGESPPAAFAVAAAILVVSVGIGVYSDATGWLNGYPYTVNIVSSVTAFAGAAIFIGFLLDALAEAWRLRTTRHVRRATAEAVLDAAATVRAVYGLRLAVDDRPRPGLKASKRVSAVLSDAVTLATATAQAQSRPSRDGLAELRDSLSRLPSSRAYAPDGHAPALIALRRLVDSLLPRVLQLDPSSEALVGPLVSLDRHALELEIAAAASNELAPGTPTNALRSAYPAARRTLERCAKPELVPPADRAWLQRTKHCVMTELDAVEAVLADLSNVERLV